jgi:hypothetical protein
MFIFAYSCSKDTENKCLSLLILVLTTAKRHVFGVLTGIVFFIGLEGFLSPWRKDNLSLNVFNRQLFAIAASKKFDIKKRSKTKQADFYIVHTVPAKK